MKRVLIVASVLALLSVGALGCQRKPAEETKKPAMEKTEKMEKADESQTATQKATVEIIDESK